ncbi:MAG TPA: hypothetical protein GX513_12920 [Firmicutes bacterium]|nr:hypothetical protein [Bacillota bacterium]
MPWVRIDEEFTQHPKLMRVGPLGIALQVAALCYCNKNLTDGFIPWAAARTLVPWEFLGPQEPQGRRRFQIGVTSGMAGEDVSPDFVIRLLVDAGIWQEVDGGYIIHDYLEYQPSREEVLAERERNRKAGKASAEARLGGNARRDTERNIKHSVQHSVECSVNAMPANRQAQCQPVPVPVPVPDTHSSSIDATCRPNMVPPMGDNTRAQLPQQSEARGKPDQKGPSPADAGRECFPQQGQKSTRKQRDQEYTADFEAFWSVYPRRAEKQRAYRAWRARLREKHSPDDLIRAAANYAASCHAKGTEERFIKHPATFLGPDKPFEEWLGTVVEEPGNGQRVPAAWPVLADYLRKHQEAEEVDTS